MKKVLNIILIFLTIISLSVSIVFVYYKTLGKDKIPSGITSTYATTITDPHTGEELSAIEANYYANKNGKGYEVVEILFNAYSGISQSAIYSRGFQLVNFNNGVDEPKLYYYDRYDGVSFETGHEYTWGDKMLISIDGEPYAVALDGKYTIIVPKINKWGIVGAIASLGISAMINPTSVVSPEVKEVQYTFEDLLVKIKSIIKSSSNGTGDSVIPLIDLGDFLHIYDVDDNGQISAEPIGVNTLTNSYFTMDTHYDNRGMVMAKQSMFGSVAYDSQFNISGLLENVEYWKSKSIVTINESDFVSRDTVDGSYYSLSLDKYNELKCFDNVDIDVIFNVSSLDSVVLGFDSQAFMGLKINSIKVYSDVEQDFVLLIDALKDTGVSSIVTKNINVIDIGGNL